MIMADFVSISHNTLKRDFSHFHNKRRSLHFQNIENNTWPSCGAPETFVTAKENNAGTYRYGSQGGKSCAKARRAFTEKFELRRKV